MNVDKLESLYGDLSQRLDLLEDHCKRLESVLHTLPVGVIALSPAGQIQSVNSLSLSLLNIKNIESQSYWEVFEDDYFGFSMQQLLMSPLLNHRVFLQLTAERQVEVIATCSQQGVVLMLHDRTHSAKLEKTLQHNQQLAALGQMAAQLAHEIRNPLGGIEGFASLLKSELSNAEHKEMASAILNGSRTLNALVTQVLDYARPLDLHFQEEDLVVLVRESCALSGGQAFMTSTCSKRSILADRERLKLAFLNLIRNGWEASRRPVHVTVTEEAVFFQDEGSGIDATILPHIFTPFFTTKHEGTGLGLSEADKVIRAHSGKLEIQETSSKGTLFSVRWI